MEVETGQVALNAGDASLWHLFWQASPLVKFVMVGLISASVICWAIVIEKILVINRLVRASDRFEGMFWSGQSLEDLYLSLGSRQMGGMAQLFIAAMREWKRSQDSAMRAGFQGVQKRIEKVMDVQLQKEMALLESRLLVLATVGSTAPFVGLFGTVWGIMNSFQAIAISKNTNLAVVAPGIAEALFATALGLLAAIPAVIFYNKFSSRYRQDRAQAGEFRRRIFRHRVAAARRAGMNWTDGRVNRGSFGDGIEPCFTGQRRSPGPAPQGVCADERDQRHAVRRRHAGAADHLHGGRAAAHRRACRSSCRETRAKPLQGDNEPLTVSVKPDGRVFLQNSEVGLDTLTPKLVAIAKNGYEERVFVRADKTVGYGDVMKVMGELNRAGFRKIGLVTDSESAKLPQ